jgi:PAS domain S-box-containing protein
MSRARKTAQDSRLRLKEERDIVSALIDTAGALAVVLDKERQIVRFNRACQKLTGYSLDEVRGKHVWDLLLIPEEVEPVKAVFKAVQEGGSPNKHESYWVSKDGNRRLISWLNTALPTQQGSVEFVLCIGTDITDQRRAEENMRIYAELLTEAQEEERKRIARELHDDTAQELSRLALDIDFLIATPKGLPEDMITRLEELRGRIDTILQGVRRFSHDLRPSLLEDFGLLVVLQWITDNLTNRYMLSSSVEVVGTPRRLSPHTELVLFRIAQEALNNVRKHSKATKAQVRLEFSPEKVTLSITDNGQGFAMPQAIGDFVRLGRLGILGMQERARLINGTFSVQSEVGKGATVTVEVPE